MFTILGSGGFIGSHLVKRLESLNVGFSTPTRGESLAGKHLGNVIYCIGLTADFRVRPFDTVEAHVCKLLEILRTSTYDSFLYLSSTRLYNADQEPAFEDALLRATPACPGDLYNISKMLGEALLYAHGRKFRIARISNVYGRDWISDNFLSAVIREAVSLRRVVLRTSMDSSKDYVNVENVVDALLKISTDGKHPVYNVASGINVSNRELLERVTHLTGCQIEVSPDAETVRFPLISIERVSTEFNYRPSNVLNDLEGIIRSYEELKGN